MSWWLIWKAMTKKVERQQYVGSNLETSTLRVCISQHLRSKTLTEVVHVQWGGNVSHGVWCCFWHFGTWRTTSRFKPRFFHVPPALSPTCADQGRDAVMRHLALIILLRLLTLITHSSALRELSAACFGCYVVFTLTMTCNDLDIESLSASTYLNRRQTQVDVMVKVKLWAVGGRKPGLFVCTCGWRWRWWNEWGHLDPHARPDVYEYGRYTIANTFQRSVKWDKAI